MLLGLVYIVAASTVYTANARAAVADSNSNNGILDYVRFGTGIQDLPSVRVDYGKFKPPVNSGDGGSGAGEDGNTINNRRRACLSVGYYLGPDDAWTDCETLCNAPETEYRYYDGGLGVFSGRRALRSGAYCVPTVAAQCNVRTSFLVYSYDGWSCLPQTPGLVGNGGNAIALCDGRIRDNALRTVYDKILPPDVAFNDFYRDKLSDGESFRFTCADDARDDSHNPYIVSPLDRFQLLVDRCVSDIPYASKRIAYENGRCQCERDSGGLWDTDPSSGICTACRAGVSNENLITRIASRACWNSGDTFSRVSAMLRSDPATPFCGVSAQDTDDSTRPRCVAAGIFYLNRPMISPAALLTAQAAATAKTAPAADAIDAGNE